ncbi:MAG: hypothetical protein LAO51_10760 [Acidobacteriia bacterium]|nr:hypothetical protein [Terriglobia bacterium]
MDATLALLRIEEVPVCLRLVDLMESAAFMTTTEATEWRRLLRGWRSFLQLAPDATAADVGLQALDRRRRAGKVQAIPSNG